MQLLNVESLCLSGWGSVGLWREGRFSNARLIEAAAVLLLTGVCAGRRIVRAQSPCKASLCSESGTGTQLCLFYFWVLQFSSPPSPGVRWQREIQVMQREICGRGVKTHQSDWNVTDKDLRVMIIPRTSRGRMIKVDLVLQELNLTLLDPPEPWAQTQKSLFQSFFLLNW